MDASTIFSTISAVAAALCLLIATLALLVTAYIFIRSRSDFDKTANMDLRLSALEHDTEADFVSDQIANCLYDLFELIGSLKAINDLSREGINVSDHLYDDMEYKIITAERHFSELGLLSKDKDRRISAQRSLSNFTGNQDTLDIMDEIANGAMGVRDEEIMESIKQLKDRIKQKRIIISAERWTGRPSGGSF